MLRLLDVAASSYREVRLGRPGLIRVCVHVQGGSGDGLDLTALRVMLVADLLVRVAELSGMQAFTAYVGGNQEIGLADRTGQAAKFLAIHPPSARAVSPKSLPAPLNDPADVHVVGPTAPPDPWCRGMSIAVGAARLGDATSEDALITQDPSKGGADPLAVRLALMSVAYSQPSALTAQTLGNARHMLDRWRRLVAEWAEFPSKPVPPQIKTMIRERLDRLDSASVTALLVWLARSEEVPAGAKFEAFVYADRMLGLDLARAIGRPGG